MKQLRGGFGACTPVKQLASTPLTLTLNRCLARLQARNNEIDYLNQEQARAEEQFDSFKAIPQCLLVTPSLLNPEP